MLIIMRHRFLIVVLEMKYREMQLNQKPEAEFINQQIASIELNRGRIEEQFCG